MQTQWRTGAIGRTGLDYQGVWITARCLDIELRLPRIWDGLQQLETEALEHWAFRLEDNS